ncbi:alpha-amylase family glycosyl hydrolase [Engelhardtia mirabilis]|uniref:Neopullulanase 2 n=1 Tax=Engelhardtia mirabilis TaxID=2528011 RepID=A0A518BLN7_9BACT|nr:Neopullulanase 2 [Planctomycetes bacterium Pla133]QDV02206.1 Neopullulanase 2 [Planctomycetes bacterium Pla86]
MLLIAAVLASSCVAVDDWPPATPLEIPVDMDVGDLPPSVRAEPAGPGRWRCEFVFGLDRQAARVAVVGDFNGWNAAANPMSRGGNGRWRAAIEIPSGSYEYKFLVEGTEYLRDPDNPEGDDDGHGGTNSVLRLGALAGLDASGARTGDGRIEVLGLQHDPGAVEFLQVQGDGRALVRLKTLARDVEGVQWCARGRSALPMTRVLRSDRFDHWEASFELGVAGLEYTFVLTDGELRAAAPRVYRVDPDQLIAVDTPDWAKHAIWYQIMPDRFRNGSEANDPDPVRPWRSEWFETSPWETRGGQTFWQFAVFQRLYGGDLQGLIEKLDYLEQLGVNAIYFNPVFQASTPHKYNATSFVHIDEHFGEPGDYARAEAVEDLLDPSTWTWTPSDRLFLDFLAAAKARGMRVIVDGVFNHVGTAHPAFRDVRERGALSPFADWFEIRSFEPFDYAGWAGYGELPVFAKSPTGLASAEVVQHIHDITRRWMDPDGDGDPSDGIDGWRLDVPNEIAMPFWADWRELVKSINPDAYITGEIWQRADAWLDGRHFDAVMNYPFARAAIHWIGDDELKIGPTELDRTLAELRLAYPSEVTYVLQNLVDSHDTDRLVSMLANPDREYDGENRPQDGADYDGARPGRLEYRRARLVALLQMTYVGAPMVYYGDEVGMWGADDPTNRKPMLWKDLEPYEGRRENHVDEEHLAHYRGIIALRRDHAALRVGDFRTLLADDERDLWVFERRLDGERVVVALNASGRAVNLDLAALLGDDANDLESIWGDASDDRRGSARVPAVGGRLWATVERAASE